MGGVLEALSQITQKSQTGGAVGEGTEATGPCGLAQPGVAQWAGGAALLSGPHKAQGPTATEMTTFRPHKAKVKRRGEA